MLNSPSSFHEKDWLEAVNSQGLPASVGWERQMQVSPSRVWTGRAVWAWSAIFGLSMTVFWPSIRVD